MVGLSLAYDWANLNTEDYNCVVGAHVSYPAIPELAWKHQIQWDRL